MADLIKGLYRKWRARQREKARGILDELKIRYHTFRIILTHNEAALNLLRSVEQTLHTPGFSWEGLSEEIDELLNVTYELIDGLNQLTGNRYGALYHRHEMLSRSVHNAMETLRVRPAAVPRCIAFDRMTRETRELTGGKAGNLAFLKQSGFPVPDGFAVTADACAEILGQNGVDLFIRQRLRRLESGDPDIQEMEADAKDIRERILRAAIPPELEKELKAAWKGLAIENGDGVSVRSSALVEDRPEHTFAGQFKSILNVISFSGFADAFKEVIASNYSARAIAYRQTAGLSPARQDMAVFCQKMVPARAAGGLFTMDPADPESGRVLISAVPGLGIAAVSGSAPTDLLRPLREGPGEEPMSAWAQIAAKTHRIVEAPDGGLIEEAVSESEQFQPVLSESEALLLVRYGRMIESLIGRPQDIEWAISRQGEIFILQSRDIRFATRSRAAVEVLGKPLLKGGVSASPGRCAGRVKIVQSTHDLEEWQKEKGAPAILVLHQSLVDVAGWLPGFEGVVVDLGNPADHLSCVAREYSRPMLTGTGKATQILQDGQWVILDADTATVFTAPPEFATTAATTPARGTRVPPPVRKENSEVANLRELVEPLNLTDAFGPTFSVQECKSLHDLIRYTHEMAVLAMFNLGDVVLEKAEAVVHRLDEDIPFHFFIIDLGGGIAAGADSFTIKVTDILSVPLRALWKGIATPGLRWNQPPPGPVPGGLFSRSVLDGRGVRPVGNQNYTIITGDYVNLNARVDFHFAMVDAVCGANSRGNYIRFRFKGGGTSAVQRERRARFVAEVLQSHNFITDQKGDLISGQIMETRQEEIEERLEMIGRLLGFSRLLDATMRDDTIPGKLARAFMDGDYGLEGMKTELGQ